jgi:hypothetical protein
MRNILQSGDTIRHPVCQFLCGGHPWGGHPCGGHPRGGHPCNAHNNPVRTR